MYMLRGKAEDACSTHPGPRHANHPSHRCLCHLVWSIPVLKKCSLKACQSLRIERKRHVLMLVAHAVTSVEPLSSTVVCNLMMTATD